MKSIIGKFYEPCDNSYCIELSSRIPELIVQPSPEDVNYRGYMINTELGANFSIVSEPYDEIVVTFIGNRTCKFVNVKSSKTGKVYRTLYYDSNVINN